MSSWWIDEPLLLGASNPTMEQLREWYEAGFRTVISFLQEDIQRPYYAVEAVKAMGYARHNIPVEDYSVPDVDQYPEFLRIVEDALKHGPVVIHCMAGQGRTGLMGAAYWIAKGLTADQAIQKVKQVNPLVLENSYSQPSLAEFEKSLSGHVQFLLMLGFERVGEWTLNQGILDYRLHRHSNESNVLYAFVAQWQVKYLGKSVRTLNQRMRESKNPGPTQRAIARNNVLIRECLSGGLPVHIYVFAPTDVLIYRTLPVNLAAGLEDILIARLGPAWNKISAQDEEG